MTGAFLNSKKGIGDDDENDCGGDCLMTDAVWVALIGGGFTFLANCLALIPQIKSNRKELKEELEAMQSKNDAKFTELGEELTKVQTDFQKYKRSDDDRYAQAVRVRILTFDDGLCDKTRPYPSDSCFRQALQDCDTYENYVDTHKDFKNSIGEDAIESIRTKYRYVKDNALFGGEK